MTNAEHLLQPALATPLPGIASFELGKLVRGLRCGVTGEAWARGLRHPSTVGWLVSRQAGIRSQVSLAEEPRFSRLSMVESLAAGSETVVCVQEG